MTTHLAYPQYLSGSQPYTDMSDVDSMCLCLPYGNAANVSAMATAATTTATAAPVATNKATMK